MANCKICQNETHELYDPQLKVTYLVCPKCDFISKHKDSFLDPEEEKARYDTHQDSNNDDYYLNTYQNIIDECIKPLNNVKTVFEFGSGQYQTFVMLLNNAGYQVTDYDLFYNPDESYKQKTYDLITTTEVIEHLGKPSEVLEELLSLLNENGYLLIMTNYRLMNEEDFLTWWYRRDPTHIGFYNTKTFEQIKEKYNLNIIYNNEKNIVVFQK